MTSSQPGPHRPIYQGLAAGSYKANNINLKIQTPTSTSDTLRLLATDWVDIGIVSLLDFLTSHWEGDAAYRSGISWPVIWSGAWSSAPARRMRPKPVTWLSASVWSQASTRTPG